MNVFNMDRFGLLVLIETMNASCSRVLLEVDVWPERDLFSFAPPCRNDLAQLKDAYTKLFEDYEELQQENKKRQVNVHSVHLVWDRQYIHH